VGAKPNLIRVPGVSTMITAFEAPISVNTPGTLINSRISINEHRGPGAGL
jgi:hypothetical protein